MDKIALGYLPTSAQTAIRGTSYTEVRITSGTAHTIESYDPGSPTCYWGVGNYSNSIYACNHNSFLIIDPAGTLASYTVTMPATPLHNQHIEINFGGTLTSGAVVTSLTLAPNTGQTILRAGDFTTANAGSTVHYKYDEVIATWRPLFFSLVNIAILVLILTGQINT